MIARVRDALRDLVTFENRALKEGVADDQLAALLKKLDKVPGREPGK